jgi:hypothetical protein
MPLDWSEVRPGSAPFDFTALNIHSRAAKTGKLWQPVLGPGIDMAACLAALEKIAKGRS